MLHVLAGAHCNNHCVFCMESDREGRRRRVSAQTPEDIRRFIETYPERDEILFTSGEPTLCRDLDRYVRWAKEAGYRKIALISNGRRLSQPKYAATMVELGINKVTISVHGHTPAIHDSLTQSDGALKQTLQGLANLAALRRRGARLELHTSTVVVRDNLPHLKDVHRLLRRFGVDRMCFNVMMVKGFGAQRFAELMPRYSDVVAEFRELTRGLRREELLRLALADVPPCVSRELPQLVLAGQERFEQFEARGSLGIAEEDLAQAAGPAVSLHRLSHKASGTDLCGDGEYYVTDRESKDEVLRVKRPACGSCILDGMCPGVWRGYVQEHGWDELVPLTDGEPTGPRRAP